MLDKELKLEWHEQKRQETLCNRGIDFEIARFILSDPNIKKYIDDRKDYGEIRYIAYGMSLGICFRIVYTIREGVYRIISMHRIHEKEKRRFYDRT